jgi:hypothetical protein
MFTIGLVLKLSYVWTGFSQSKVGSSGLWYVDEISVSINDDKILD